MFGNLFNKREKGRKTQFVCGSDGHMSTVTHTGSNSFFVSGSHDHDGLYHRQGNTVMGPNGVSTVIGSGSTKTVISPDGKSHTVIDSGGFKTIL